MADEIAEIEERNRQLYDDYVRERSIEDLIRDVERDIVPTRPIALALIRQREENRAKVKAIVHHALAMADGLEQLVALLGELPVVVAVPDPMRILFADDEGDHGVDQQVSA